MATQIITGATSFNALTFYATRTINLASSGNFAVSGSFLAIGSANDMIVLSATTGGQRGLLAVKGGQNVVFVVATDIDSSAGTTVSNVGGTTSNTINWSIAAAIDTGQSNDTLSYAFSW